MAFALRMNFVDVIVDNSLKNNYVDGKKNGYQFDIRLSYYRGHFLSVIDEFAVKVDGQKVADDQIKFCLNGKELSPWQLKEAYDEFWPILEPATIKVHQKGGLEAGDHHVELVLYFRAPYMPIGPNHQYMEYDSCGEKTLPVIG
ncbi:C-glycoside deglycosidase beta subunit domain-containing protein [Ligilactobacillus agilis]|uniref:C-glycoside deglycosidase beta subunit domain-containing protein n=1 Tax=Ligilactobacillus agilis TaxID=1601 RepID=UPI00067F67D8|nr:DUF6379 domain-containing protein [Ligilactobacillus agilis]